MRKISIDIETYSDVDLKRCGVYKYAESPNFAVLLFGYSVDEGEVEVVDLANGETIPDEVLVALEDMRMSQNGHITQTLKGCACRDSSDIQRANISRLLVGNARKYGRRISDFHRL